MRLISAQALKEKLDRRDPLKLVNALGEWEYRAARIPGSLHFATPEETLRGLGRDDETATGTFDASQAACRSGRRQAIPGRDDGGISRRQTQDLSSLDAATPARITTPISRVVRHSNLGTMELNF